MMTEVSTYRIGRQRIVQTDKHDHALRDGDERALCDKYSAKVLLLHDLPFIAFGEHACDECSRLVQVEAGA